MTSGALPGFAEVIDQAPDAIVLIDATGAIVYANQRVIPLFGYSPVALLGQPVEVLVPERLRVHHAGYRQGYARDPKVRPMGDARLALTGRRADGSEFPVDIHLAPIRSDGHRWTLGVIRDATERHRFLDELREARHAAEQVARVKGEFLSLAAHDLCQPEQTLELVIGALGRSTLQASDVTELTTVASAALARMRELLKMLLQISRLESGTLKVNDEPVSVADIYKDLERQFGPVARAKELRYVSAPCPNIVATDPTLLRGMLGNLLSNAIRYTRQGEVRIQCSTSEGGGLQLAVQDTGIGIPNDQLHAIFEDFNRLAEAREAHVEGFGLGLGIVRRLSSVLGLPVTVESAPGRGSTFCVQIPPDKVFRAA